MNVTQKIYSSGTNPFVVVWKSCPKMKHQNNEMKNATSLTMTKMHCVYFLWGSLSLHWTIRKFVLWLYHCLQKMLFKFQDHCFSFFYFQWWTYQDKIKKVGTVRMCAVAAMQKGSVLKLTFHHYNLWIGVQLVATCGLLCKSQNTTCGL